MKLSFQPKIQSLKHKFIIAFFAVFGPIILLSGSRDYAAHQRLLHTGVPASARVTNSHLEQANKGANRYRLDLLYQARSGQQKGVLYLAQEEYESLENPKTIPILYSKENPENVELRGGRSDDWMGIAAGLFITLGGWWGILPSFSKRNTRWAEPESEGS